MKKTEKRVIRDAIKAVADGFGGVVAKGSRRALCLRLQDEGLLKYAGHGYEEDGSTDREFPLYIATEKGIALVNQETG